MKCFECGTETKDLTGSFLNGIEAGNDAALVVRAVAGCQMPDALMYMPRLFEAFRAHRTGPAVRESGWESGWGANESQTRKE